MKTNLREDVLTEADGEITIDRENGVIRNVRVLGKHSRNKREYSDKAMADAVALYEGVDVNVDHEYDGKKRKLAEGWGVLRDPRIDGEGKDKVVRADLHYLKSHNLTEMLLERAERFPRRFGLSHDADGVTSRKGGSVLVESLDKVNSVDLVRNPATNHSLKESENNMATKTVKAILAEAFPKTYKTARIWEMDEGAIANMPVDVPAESSSDDQIKAAFEQAIVAKFRDDKLDSKATLKAIKEILTAYEKLSGKSEAAPAEKPAETEHATEAEQGKSDPALSKLLEDLAEMKLRDRCRDLCADADVKPTAKLLEQLVDADTDLERKSLIEAAKGEQPEGLAGAKRKPLVRTTLQESAAPVSFPKDNAAFVRAIK